MKKVLSVLVTIAVLTALLVLTSFANEAKLPMVYAGYNFAAAINTNGDLFTWGDNYYGQLGDGSSDRTTPKKVMSNVKMAAVGHGTDYYMLALKNDGTLWAWGECGPLNLDSKKPIRIATNVVSVKVSGASVFIIKNDNTLWACGYNGDSNLGIGMGLPGDKVTSFTKVLTNVKEIFVDPLYSAAFALKKDGTLWAWGDRIDEDLMASYHSPEDYGRQDFDTMYMASQIDEKIAECMFYDHVLYCKRTTGGLISYRYAPSPYNKDYYMYSRSNSSFSYPVKFRIRYGEYTLETDATGNKLKATGGMYEYGSSLAVSNGSVVLDNFYYATLSGETYTYAMAITKDGNLWAWGYNYDGRLGIGNKVDQNKPVKVMNLGAPNAEAKVIVKINGSTVTFADQKPVIEGGRTLVPVRAAMEKAGATVSWDGATSTSIIKKGGTTVKLTIGSSTMYVNGRAVTLDVPAKIINNRTLIPLRAVAEALNGKVSWDASTSTANITF